MTNEELVARIQSGEGDLILALRAQTVRFVRRQAYRAVSLDAPLNTEEGGDTLGDVTEDPSGAQGFQEAEERLWSEITHPAGTGPRNAPRAPG